MKQTGISPPFTPLRNRVVSTLGLHLLFNFRESTISTSSLFIVTRTHIRHCGLNRNTAPSKLLSDKKSNDSISDRLKTSVNGRLFCLFNLLQYSLIFFNHVVHISKVFDDFSCFTNLLTT